MKKLLFIFLFAMVAAGASAQLKPVNFGVKAGIISTNADILKGGKDGINNLFSDSNTGWQIGFMSRINLAMFHIQPEILFNMNGYDLQVDGASRTSYADVKLRTLDVPVLFGVRLLFIRMQAGPTFNLMTETKLKNSKGDINFVKADRSSVGFTAGLGVDLWNFNLDIRYNGNFKRMKQDIQVENERAVTYSTKFNSWMFSLGYMF